jgi:hypothetical protein
MKRNFIVVTLCALCLCAQASAAPAVAAARAAQEAPPPAPEAEVKAAQAVQSAADAAAALKAAEVFVKKHPRSVIRPQVARIAADKIGATADAAARASQGENFLKIFSAPEEANLINQHLVRAYVDVKRYDDAYRVGSVAAVEKFSDPVAPMLTLAITGVQLARQQNPKYVEQSVRLGMRAIELIEADKKPAGVDAADWADYKTKWLPQVYQELGFLSLSAGNLEDAKAKLARAAALNTTDPQTYALLGYIADQEYKKLAEEHKAAAAGAPKNALLAKAHEQMDKVIEAYAHAIGLADGEARFEQLRTQLREDLENYYKYRKGSSEGLQQLIDKYKKAKS